MRSNAFRAIGLGMMLCVFMALAGCGNDSTEPKNRHPSTPVINPTAFAILPQGSVTLGASSTDPDGDDLTFTWTFSAGAPLSVTGAFAAWTAPDCDCSVEANVVATDGHGGHATSSTVITVTPNATYAYSTPFSGTLEPDVSDLGTSATIQAISGTCHFWASVVATWTSAAVFVFTGLPTAAFLAALTEYPVWVTPATWIWSYTVPWGGSSAALIELKATLSEFTYLDWEMHVSGTIQQYDRFQWVSGRSRTDAIEGHWLLYDYRFPDTPTQALRIDYARRAADDRDLSYHSVLAGSASVGDSLNFSVRGTESVGFLHDVSDGSSVGVVWDSADGHGRFIGAGGDSCCWGPAPTYADITCP